MSHSTSNSGQTQQKAYAFILGTKRQLQSTCSVMLRTLNITKFISQEHHNTPPPQKKKKGSHFSHEVFCGVQFALNSDTKGLKVGFPGTGTTASKLALGCTGMIRAAEQVGYVLNASDLCSKDIWLETWPGY
jgi:hypothetical protein